MRLGRHTVEMYASAIIAFTHLHGTQLTNERAWSRDHATSLVTCCFAAAGPTLWNSLPEQLRQPDITFGQFKRSLKPFVWLVGPRRAVYER